VAESTRCSSAKTAKPYPGFPLTPHPSRRWCKKIRGKLHYFGKLDDPTAALERFNREWPYLKDGRTPLSLDAPDGLTVRVLCNKFLTAKKARLDSGELSPRTFADYFTICGQLVDGLGRDRRVDDLRTDDFAALRAKWSRTWGAVRLRNEINRARVVFKYAFDERLIDKPVHYGQSFARPSAKTLRKARNAQPPKKFEADEARRIINAADVQMRGMVLLGLNCGFGNTDCAALPKGAVDLERSWIDFPRPKTEVRRRVPLWPETVEALRQAIAARPRAKESADADCVFLTQCGVRWVRSQAKRGDTSGAAFTTNVLSARFATLLKRLGINGHRNFYALRHCFETIGGECKDQVAVDFCMGHCDESMAQRYREGISDERLKAVVNTVHAWLWPPEVNAAQN
jgi:integrase